MTEVLPDPAVLATMSAAEIRELLDAIPDQHLSVLAEASAPASQGVSDASLLPHQIPPEPGWDGWLMMGGRGCGKTFTTANFLGRTAEATPNLRARIIAPTLSDAVNAVVLDPDSGILAHFPHASLKTSGPEGVRVVFPNNSTIWCVGTPTLKDVDRLRALTNIDLDHFEEAAANPMLAEAVAQAALSRRGNRLPKPVWIGSTTPRPTEQILIWKKTAEDLIAPSEDIRLVHASMMDNPHTPQAYRDHAESLQGTRLYRQEILGEVLEDIEGALWTMRDIERSYWPGSIEDLRKTLVKVVVGVDPASGGGTTGIIVVGKDGAGRIWILADYSVEDAQPGEWARQVVKASEDWGGALVVAERNQGHRMVEAVLKNAKATLPTKGVWSREGKDIRADPVAVLWEADQQVGGMVKGLALLETELCEWVPGMKSPDRLDAMVHAVTHLMGGAGQWKVVGAVIGGRGFRSGGQEVGRAGRVRWGA